MPCTCCSHTCEENNNKSASPLADTKKLDTSVNSLHFLKSEKLEIIKLILAALLGITGVILFELSKTQYNSWLHFVSLVFLILSYLLAGFKVLKAAALNIIHGKLFDELFLMSLATIGAFAIGAFEEAVGVMIFYRVGELFEERAVKKSRASISALLSMKPSIAHKITNDTIIDISPDTITQGDLLLIRPGEKVPVDGILIYGKGSIDTSSITGESLPRNTVPGDTVYAGSISLDSLLTIRAEKRYEDSTIARILYLVESAAERKAKAEQFITKFAKVYTPIVVILALGIALLPPLLLQKQTFSYWLYKALVMLVISCPCAFVLSIPLTYFAGIGGMAKHGILVKGAFVLDTLAHAQTIVFDKTGTLTDGHFRVTSIIPSTFTTKETLLEYAGQAAHHSNHPLAKAIHAYWKATTQNEHSGNLQTKNDQAAANTEHITMFKEIHGKGIETVIAGKKVYLGNDSILHYANIPHTCESSETSVVHIAIDNIYGGKFEFGDTLKSGSKTAIKRLKKLGINKIIMLTGDSETPALEVANQLNITDVKHSLLPEEKLQALDDIISDNSKNNLSSIPSLSHPGTVLYAGDGINDTPVLARADAGIAMGKNASEAAIETADVVLMSGNPDHIADAIVHARKTRNIVLQNIVFTLGIKVFFLSFGAFGLASMWEAVIADVGVALLAVLNAVRALR